MKRTTITSGDIIELDDQHIDVEEINYVGKIHKDDSKSGEQPKDPLFKFSFVVYLRGSNRQFIFCSDEEETCELKREFILEKWSMYCVISRFEDWLEIEDDIDIEDEEDNTSNEN